MKKIILLSGIVLGCLLLTANFALELTSAVAAKKSKVMPMELDGTRWTVEVVFVNKKGKKEVREDTLIFEDKKFTSKRYKKKGYGLTNYSLIVNEDNITRFGTMQIKDKETSFWKGQVSGETINGSIHVQRSSGNNDTNYFSGKLASGTLRRKGAPKPAPPPPPPKKVVPAQKKKAPVKAPAKVPPPAVKKPIQPAKAKAVKDAQPKKKKEFGWGWFRK